MRTSSRAASPSTAERRSRSGLRVACARPADVGSIHDLIVSASRDSMVLPRDAESVRRHIKDFIVIKSGRKIVACGALQAVYPGGLAEIRSVVVAPDQQGRGTGARLVGALVERARELGLRRIFLLTDRPDFFRKAGFKPATMETLPHKVWNDCIHCPRYHDCIEVALDMTFDER